MVDLVPTIVSIIIGMMGGILWWATPPRPPGTAAILARRVLLGLVVGFLGYAAAGVNPINASGNFDPAGTLELIAIGYGGLPALSAVLPKGLGQKFDSRIKVEPRVKPRKDNKHHSPAVQDPMAVEKRNVNVRAHESHITVQLMPPEKDAEYTVNVEPHWTTSIGIVDKTNGGFTVEFGTHPPHDSSLEIAITP